MTTLQIQAQSLQPGDIVSLFMLDAAPIGGPQRYFVQGSEVATKITFGGIEYTPIDIEFKGLETTGQGALPTPRIKLANHDGLIQNLVNTYGDLMGCHVYRLRTFGRFLDGHPDADAGAVFGPDIFEIRRKVTENPVYIEWELSAAVDQEGKQLPGRQVIRDTCLWRYRVWNAGTGTFDYSKALCPYAGTAYFDINDQPVVNAADDKPSRRISCCKTRFGAAAALPFGGFPGVARVNG